MTSQPGGPGPATASRPSWPELPLGEWQATRDTLQLWTQIVGKVRMANEPLVNHWWNVTLYLAVTRFSGRPAPPHPGRPPHLGPHVMLEAYSHEVSSAGYWPGGEGQGFFYSYSYPEPDGYRESAVRPADAFYSQELGEFLLPYEAAAASDNPGQVLLEFLQSTYEAAANCASWDRAALERHG